MLSYFSELLSSNQLAPHGYCLMWQPELVWTHVFSDAVTGLAYVAIAATLVLFVKRRDDLAFGWMFSAFAAFILLCGATHLFSIVTFWLPYYGVEGIIKLATAIVSAGTAIALVFLLPRALALPSPETLRIANLALEREMVTRAEAEAMLRQAQKIEALGQLTGGVAHDFNNLLTPIMAGLHGARTAGDARLKALSTAGIEAAERARDLVARLLAFARKQPLELRPVDLAGLVSDMRELIARSIGPSIHLEIERPASPAAAMADPNQIELAILNLCVNARDAMPDGGSLTITVTKAEGDTPALPDAPSGHYVAVSVADSGAGMDQETAQRAIEPFFTTKEPGKGTGLGLSSVHGLAAQSGGGLSIRSAPGAGTTITFWLPATEAPVTVAPDTPKTPVEALASPSARILLVDDEVLVRTAAAIVLRGDGLEVIEAGSGAAALKLVDEGLVPDLLITDQLMPNMRGDELASALRERFPDLKVLVATGYTDLPGLDYPRMSKPFAPDALITRVRAELTDKQK